MSNQTFPARLLSLRQEKGITQSALALALGVSDKVISKWETGASEPSLDNLIALARFYETDTDTLLGIATAEKTLDAMAEAILDISDLSPAVSLLRVEQALAEAVFRRIGGDGDGDKIPQLPFCQDVISVPSLYHLAVTTPDANFALTLLKNERDFAFLKDKEMKEKIAALLAFMGDGETISLLRFLHSKDCSSAFTAEFAAARCGLNPTHTKDILNRAVALGICTCLTAHMTDGERMIYESGGDGRLLGILTLAYHLVKRENCWNFAWHAEAKMIERGEEA